MKISLSFNIKNSFLPTLNHLKSVKIFYLPFLYQQLLYEKAAFNFITFFFV